MAIDPRTRIHSNQEEDTQYGNIAYSYPNGTTIKIKQKGPAGIEVYHPSGSYMVMKDNGDIYVTSTGEMKSSAVAMTITSSQNADIKVQGVAKISATTADVQVAGTGSVTVGQTATLNFLEHLAIRAQNIVMSAAQNFTLDVGGVAAIASKGPLAIGSSATITAQASKIDLNPNGSQSGYRTNSAQSGPSGIPGAATGQIMHTALSIPGLGGLGGISGALGGLSGSLGGALGGLGNFSISSLKAIASRIPAFNGIPPQVSSFLSKFGFKI